MIPVLRIFECLVFSDLKFSVILVGLDFVGI